MGETYVLLLSLGLGLGGNFGGLGLLGGSNGDLAGRQLSALDDTQVMQLTPP